MLRDKRSLFLIILAPLFLYPIMMTFSGLVFKEHSKKLQKAEVYINMSSSLKTSLITERLSAEPHFVLNFLPNDEVEHLKETVDISILNTKEPTSNFTADSSLELKLYFDAADDISSSAKSKINRLIRLVNNQITKSKLRDLNIPPSILTPMKVKTESIASQQETMGFMIGKILPGMLMLFLAMGAFHVGNDMIAGEKERKTFQSLIAAPLRPIEIIVGKFITIVAVSIVAASANVLSLIISVMLQVRIMGQQSLGKLDTLSLSISPKIIAIGFLLILLGCALSAILVMVISMSARSYKEATSYTSPLMILYMIPLVLNAVSSGEEKGVFSLIPIYGIVGALGNLMTGNIYGLDLTLTIGSTIGFMAIGLVLLNSLFKNENAITGQKVSLKTKL